MSEEKTEIDMVKAVFSNDKGRELLDYWDEIVNMKPSFHPGNTAEQTAFNEGVRSFYLAIVTMLEDTHG